MSETTFKVGDIVQLISGGPAMTVDSFGYGNDEDEIKCVWFKKDEDEAHERDSNVFKPGTLRKMSPGKLLVF